MIVLLSPYTIVESGTGEDESIVAFIFILAVVLMLIKRQSSASAAIGVGIWTKMFPILLFPVHFLQQRDWKGRITSVLFLGLATGADRPTFRDHVLERLLLLPELLLPG